MPDCGETVGQQKAIIGCRYNNACDTFCERFHFYLSHNYKFAKCCSGTTSLHISYNIARSHVTAAFNDHGLLVKALTPGWICASAALWRVECDDPSDQGLARRVQG